MSAVAVARFTVEAIPEAVAAHVRAHGRDRLWGHRAVTQPATGFGPCRLCLRTFREGEQRTLFTYDTYAGVAEFPQPGPVFVALKIVPEVENVPIGQRTRWQTRTRDKVLADFRAELGITA